MESIQSLLTTENIAYAVFAVLAVIIAFIIIKKVAGCFFRLVVFLLLIAALAYVYINYIDKDDAPDTGKPLMEFRVTDGGE